MIRVCKPDGKLIIINHLKSERKIVSGFMGTLNPVTKRLGWRIDLCYHDLINDLPIEVEKRFKTSPLSLFTVVLVKNRPTHHLR
jgi:hypothetical protein